MILGVSDYINDHTIHPVIQMCQPKVFVNTCQNRQAPKKPFKEWPSNPCHLLSTFSSQLSNIPFPKYSDPSNPIPTPSQPHHATASHAPSPRPLPFFKPTQYPCSPYHLRSPILRTLSFPKPNLPLHLTHIYP